MLHIVGSGGIRHYHAFRLQKALFSCFRSIKLDPGVLDFSINLALQDVATLLPPTPAGPISGDEELAHKAHLRLVSQGRTAAYDLLATLARAQVWILRTLHSLCPHFSGPSPV